MKKFISMMLSMVMCLSMASVAFAAEYTDMDVEENVIELSGVQMTNETESFDNEQLSGIWKSIQCTLEDKYGAMYSFENYKVKFFHDCTNSDNIAVNVDILVDMTLTCAPSDNQYFVGFENAIEERNAGKAAGIYAAQKEDAEAAYGKPDVTSICLQVQIPRVSQYSRNTAEEIKLYDRFDVGEDEEYLVEFDDTELANDQALAEKGVGIAEAYANSSAEPNEVAATGRAASYTYKRLVARDYALAHGADVPEYSAANGNGSDCANFLSKCLNKGGIPTSSTWYQGSVNWIRTGAYDNGGVTPYMKNKGYFYYTSKFYSAFAGSFLYWNTTPRSHVALVTYGDGSVVKITDHSNTQRKPSQVNRLISDAYRKEAKVYMPTTYVTA